MKLTLPANKGLKWALGVIGAILIGAIGSGVWQSVLGPALHAISRWLLDLGSLGLTSYKTNVYRSVAKDNQFLVGIPVFVLVSTVLIVIMVSAGLQTWERNYNARIRRERLLRNLDGPDPEPSMTAEDMRRRLITGRRLGRIEQIFLYISALYMLGFFVAQSLVFVKLNYVDSADSHYHQVLRVVSPYLNDHERAMTESDFAQIGSREDYVKVLSKLEKLAKDNGRTVPAFDPW